MHNELKLKMENGKLKINRLYKRLYGKYRLYSSLQKAFKDDQGKAVLKNGDIQTSIIGKQPDLSQFRNFVSLDTRSREIRNRIETLKNGKKEK